jgi:CTP:molybdopterin cytidylyltransferase MocA
MPAFDTGPSMPEVESENKSPTVFAVVLAAGGSNRFGRSKQLEGFEGRPLVRRAAELARSVCGDRNVLLVGHESAAVVAAAGDAPQYLVVNDRYEEHLRALIDTWSGADSEIVATAFSGTLGPPVLFPRGAFAALSGLSGDKGAKSVLQDPRFDVRTIPFEDAAIDIDTPGDLERIAHESRQGAPRPK